MALTEIPHDLIHSALEWRRHLHSIPELAFDEHETSRFVSGMLEGFGILPVRGYGGTGLVGAVTKGTSGKTIGLRADMDALPILENANLPYSSKHPGRMHACGHDGHMAMLLAAASLTHSLEFDGTVRFIFQPAEENEAGAERMIEDGLFRDHPVDAVFGLHNWPQLPRKAFVANDGPMMAAFSTFDIDITGKGAHAALPHEGIDPIAAGAAVVAALQTIVSREISAFDTAVLSVTQFHAGDAYNIIPERVSIKGTGRWFSKEAGDILETRLLPIVSDVCTAHRCTATVQYNRRYPATINTPVIAADVRRAAKAVKLDVGMSAPSMVAEDFAFMLDTVPGAYAWLGSAKDGLNPGLHSPDFDFNDDVLGDGIAYWCGLIETWLPRR